MQRQKSHTTRKCTQSRGNVLSLWEVYAATGKCTQPLGSVSRHWEVCPNTGKHIPFHLSSLK